MIPLIELMGKMRITLLLAMAGIGLLALGACKQNPAPLYPVTLINESSHQICSVKFYRAGSYHMPARNLLRKSLFRTHKLAPGESIVLNIPEGVYDIRIKTCDRFWWGEDVFAVPANDRWTISDDRLTPIVR